jgi:hypothetical protein
MRSSLYCAVISNAVSGCLDDYKNGRLAELLNSAAKDNLPLLIVVIDNGRTIKTNMFTALPILLLIPMSLKPGSIMGFALC